MSTKKQSNSSSYSPKVIRASPKFETMQGQSTNVREEAIKIYRSGIYQKTHALLIGAGGPGGFVALGLMRKGVKELTICDGDIVDITNLNRQRFFACDLGKYKASQLAINLRKEAVYRTRIKGIDLYFEEALEEGYIKKADIIVCAPDDDETRIFAAQYCLANEIPLITIGLSPDSDYGYVFIQYTGADSACFGCMHKGISGKEKCGVSSNINLSIVAAGHLLTACDAILSKTKLGWNFHRFSIFGKMPDSKQTIPQWSECKICKNQ